MQSKRTSRLRRNHFLGKRKALGFRPRLELLEARRMLAADALVGVDFGLPAASFPTNWNHHDGGGATVLSGLIDEDGDGSPWSLSVWRGDGVETIPQAATVPSHVPNLQPIDGALAHLQAAPPTYQWQGLQPNAAYEVYVFGLSDDFNDHRVTVNPGLPDEVSFDQVGDATVLWINGEMGDNTRSLESFAVVVNADAAGVIEIDVAASPGSNADIDIGGLALRTAHFVEHDHFHDTEAQMNLFGKLPDGTDFNETIDLLGPTWVDVWFENREGEAHDDDGNGLDDVMTKVMGFDLQGLSAIGPVHVGLNPERMSTGVIEELENNNPGRLDLNPFHQGDARSWFDLYFEITVITPNGPVKLYNVAPKQMHSIINHKPPAPGDAYESPTTIPLFLDPAGTEPSGIFLGPGRHVPNPPPHFVEHDHFEETEATITLINRESGLEERVELKGPTWIDVWFEDREGEAHDDDGNQLDEVMTKIVELDLQGSSSLGAVQVGLNPDIMSTGIIEEHENNNPGWLDLDPFHPGDAWSWFNVFVEITVDTPNGPVTLVNLEPKMMHETITHKPPGQGDAYESPTTIPLFFKFEDGGVEPSPFELGPGRHVPRPGHFVEHDHFHETEAEINLFGTLPDGRTVDENVALTGPTWVDVWFEDSEGEAHDDTDAVGNPGANGLDDVMTKMVDLKLQGHSSLGPVHVGLNPNIESVGVIEEKENNHPGWLDLDPFHEGDANSVFDLFLEITVQLEDGTNVVLHNRDPKRLRSMITHKPPGEGDEYESPETIELFLPDGTPSGLFLGPGRHVPNPPPHFVEHDHFHETEAKLNLLGPRGFSEEVHLTGPTWIDVWFDGPEEGQANDDDGDGRDEVMTKVRELDLRGVSSIGPVRVQQNPDVMSIGEIEELENNNEGWLDLDPFHEGDADSWFNMFFKITVGAPTGNVMLFNRRPKMMHETITEKPPGEGNTYESPDTIPLYFADGTRSPYSLGPASHTPQPHFVEHDHFHETEAEFELMAPDGSTQTVFLSGPTWVDVWFERREGEAHDDDGDGRDEVMTIMRDLDLQGVVHVDPSNPTAVAPIHVGLNPNNPSVGMIKELENNNPGWLDVDPFHPGDAESWFDLFLEVQIDLPGAPLPGDYNDDGVVDAIDYAVWREAKGQPVAFPFAGADGDGDGFVTQADYGVWSANYGATTGLTQGNRLVLHNDIGKELHSIITHKPPGEGDVYESPSKIPLLLPDGTESGYFLGPARHVPNPPPHFVEHDHFHETDAEFNLVGTLPDGRQIDEIIGLAGPTWIDVWFEREEGAALDDDSDGLDEVMTKVVELDLRGNTSLGPIRVQQSPLYMSAGEIEELVNNNPGWLDLDPFHEGDASSWFNMFFLVTIDTPNGPVRLVNREPKMMHSIITHKPPGEGDVYENPDFIRLYTLDGAPTELFLGPGRHVPNPPAHFVEHDHFERTEVQFNLISPDGFSQTIDATGPTWVDVWFDGREGEADDNDGDGLDEVMTEMVALDLRGNVQLDPSDPGALAPIQVGLHPDIASTGLIRELQNNNFGWLDVAPFHPGSALSWFDLYFEFTVITPDGPLRLYNVDPKQMHSIINHKPPAPGDVYESPTTIPLYFDPAGTIPSGYFLGPGRHVPNPPPHFVEHDHFDDSEATFELIGQLPDGTTIDETIIARGPTWIDVWFDGPVEGEAHDNDGNNRDEVMTKVVDLELKGQTSNGAEVVVRANPNIMSTGLIEELQNGNPGWLDLDPFHPGDAESWFNMFFEITVQTPDGPLPLVNLRPKMMHAIITEKPPGIGDVYENPEFIDLYVPNTDGTFTFSGLRLGPGRHVPRPDDAPPDFIEHDLFQDAFAAFELILPGTGPQTVATRGSIAVDVFFEGPTEGDASDNDNNGLDEVQTEMVALSLSGDSQLGPIQVRLSPNQQSLGQIEELNNSVRGTLDLNPFGEGGQADSFFDIWFEIEIPGVGLLHNNQPKHMQGLIANKPPGPGESYFDETPIELFDANNNPTGIIMAFAQATPAGGDIGFGAVSALARQQYTPGMRNDLAITSVSAEDAIDSAMAIVDRGSRSRRAPEVRRVLDFGELAASDFEESDSQESVWDKEEDWLASSLGG